jgi:hypothetical protein
MTGQDSKELERGFHNAIIFFQYLGLQGLVGVVFEEFERDF